MPKITQRAAKIQSQFDMDLSTSPVYIDYDSLTRNYACSYARREFKAVFGKNAKIPVNKQNWEAMGHMECGLGLDSMLYLNREWIVEVFNWGGKKHPPVRITNNAWGDSTWDEVERALRALRPDWYAAQPKPKLTRRK